MVDMAQGNNVSLAPPEPSKEPVKEEVHAAIDAAASEVLPSGMTKDALAKQLAKEVAMMLNEKNIAVRMDEQPFMQDQKLETIISHNGEVQILQAELKKLPENAPETTADQIDSLSSREATTGQGPKEPQVSRGMHID